jgi:hypothetical protein
MNPKIRHAATEGGGKTEKVAYSWNEFELMHTLYVFVAERTPSF